MAMYIPAALRRKKSTLNFYVDLQENNIYKNNGEGPLIKAIKIHKFPHLLGMFLYLTTEGQYFFTSF